MENIRRQERKENKRIFTRDKLPGRFMTGKLFGWTDKRYSKEY